MIKHVDIRPDWLRAAIHKKEIIYAGNQRLKIYGHLSCNSGKRMLQGNRVFFGSEEEALQAGFRPCGHCMRESYQNWKNGSV
ncbi:MAG: Ada metal-binding domain-containing protein [Bacteroidota bacterium]